MPKHLLMLELVPADAETFAGLLWDMALFWGVCQKGVGILNFVLNALDFKD